ncbi:hypothetical protein [Actinomadura verrucosospora]|uniref:Secreted protein n=1 Tax=Actinomadura verrucosospora TaxID=46165 RepID=A0A7D3W1A2_ACTVE|nr:hypothetical protein [Actinomadura verrucosospora]QKG27099.1 hypothetical protein ACTIVE_8752 [Actinomadura verrucosospora]
MQKKLGTILAGAGLGASLIALSAPAHATTTGTWTVTPGGNVTANIAPLTKVIAKDPSRGTQAVCSGATGGGVAASGSGLSGTHLVTINSLTASGCIGPGNANVTITMNGLPWYMNADSYNATTGVTTGTVTGIKATYSNPVDGCVATITGPAGAGGSVAGTYTNSTHKLAAGGSSTLVVNTVNTSCSPTQIQVGDPITLTGTLVVSPNQTVTSP